MIDPRGMKDVVEWSDFVTMPLERIGVTPRRLDHAENWKEWAFDLIQDSRLEGFQTPDPRVYAEWRDWAERFNEVVPY